jgi:aryl-alcohol dehydrogenase-like predicted oxidoreductase
MQCRFSFHYDHAVISESARLPKPDAVGRQRAVCAVDGKLGEKFMTLPKRPLGLSDVPITVTGFGAWALGGGGWAYSWGPQDDNVSIATMRHALDLGINWIDTAAVYGLGHSEEVVGRLLREVPESQRPLVFTKCGLIWDERNPKAEPRRVLKPEWILKECDASLRRLGVKRIDLYQFHWPDETGTPVEESWGEMVRLIEQEKIRMAGVSNFNVSLLERCEAIMHVDSLQPPFSLIHRDAAEREIPWCAQHGTGVICYSPMQSGLLTDSFTAEIVSKLAEDDWRRRAPDFQEPRLSRNLALRDALRPIAQRHGTTVSAIAVAWVIAWPGVTGAIVGARSPQQVDGWISAATVKLSTDDLTEIANAIKRTGAGTGPIMPQLQRAA